MLKKESKLGVTQNKFKMLFLVVERIGLPKQSKRPKMGASTTLNDPFFMFCVTPMYFKRLPTANELSTVDFSN
jgi:hypothetical protein